MKSVRYFFHFCILRKVYPGSFLGRSFPCKKYALYIYPKTFSKIILDFTRNKCESICLMKLQTTTNTIEQIGSISDEAQFTMKTSRKAFQILSDLYSDKPLAIVRELGANAKDAMTAAGKGDQPFSVKLPNALEPWLVIEDKGTGISHQDIYNVYTKYFESTKSESNDYVGCLGLGSKSPFCYTDNFLITSTHQGVKRIYNAFFSQNGTPTISLMSTENSDQGNGLAIQIPVKRADVVIFEQAIAKAFRFFAVKPTITGGSINWKEDKRAFDGDGWESHGGFSYGECYAIMGGVTYPVNRHQLNEQSRSLCERGGLVMYFNIGELDVTPSRESLSYDDSTIKALNNKLTFIKKDFQEKLTKVIEDKENLLEALRSHYHLYQQFSHLKVNFDAVTWKGIDLSNPAQLIAKISDNGVKTFRFQRNSRTKYGISCSASIETKSKWYVDNLDKGTDARIKQHLRNNPEDVISVFTKSAYDKLTKNPDANRRFDVSMFTPTSTLPKVVNASKGGTRIPRTSFNVYEFGTAWRSAWDAELFDASKPPKYYIVKGSSWDFSMTTNLGSFHGKRGLQNLLEFMGVSTDDVVLVSPSNEKNLAGLSKSLVDHANTFTIKIDKDDIATVKEHSCHSFQSIWKSPRFKNLKQDSDFVKFVLGVCKAQNNVAKYKTIAHNLPSGGGKALQVNTKCPLTALCVKNLTKYGWDTTDILTIMESI